MIGADFKIKRILAHVAGTDVRLHLWDPIPSGRFTRMDPNERLLRTADVAVILIPATCSESEAYESVTRWYRVIQDRLEAEARQCGLMVVLTKSDLVGVETFKTPSCGSSKPRGKPLLAASRGWNRPWNPYQQITMESLGDMMKLVLLEFSSSGTSSHRLEVPILMETSAKCSDGVEIFLQQCANLYFSQSGLRKAVSHRPGGVKLPAVGEVVPRRRGDLSDDLAAVHCW
jgi:hypothetical protein